MLLLLLLPGCRKREKFTSGARGPREKEEEYKSKRRGWEVVDVEEGVERERERVSSPFMVLVDGTYPTSLLQTVQQFREESAKERNDRVSLGASLVFFLFAIAHTDTRP